MFITALKQLVEGIVYHNYIPHAADPVTDTRCRAEQTRALLGLQRARHC